MEPSIIFEKFYFPDEKEEEDEQEFQPFEESDRSNVLTQILAGQQNPFLQLRTYNIWTIHTNFKMSATLSLLVEDILGVESLEIVSPYRMYVGIGRVFEESEVKQTIQNKLLEAVNGQKSA
jgi:hypothetical protein